MLVNENNVRSLEPRRAVYHGLHHRQGTFLVSSSGDAGTARLLGLLGLSALAGTRADLAFSQGLPDSGIGRGRVICHLAELAAALDLHISADPKNGFGISSPIVAEMIRLAAAADVVGASIDDPTGSVNAPIPPRAVAVDRIRAAVEVARGYEFPFIVTARTDNYMVG